MLTQHFYTPNTCAGCQQYGNLEPYTVTDADESVTVWLHIHCLTQLHTNAKHLKIEPAVQYLITHPTRPMGKR